MLVMVFCHLVLCIFLWSFRGKKSTWKLYVGVWFIAAQTMCVGRCCLHFVLVPFQSHPSGIDAIPFCLGIRNQKYRRLNWRMAAWEAGLFPLRKTSSKYLCTILVILEPDMNTYIQAMHCIHSCLLQYLSCAEFVQRIAGLSPWSNKSLQVFPYLYLLKGNTPLQGLLLHSCD